MYYAFVYMTVCKLYVVTRNRLLCNILSVMSH